MKRQWSTEELIECFTLLPEEQAIIPRDTANANLHNQLGFAVMLKFFQLEARFPNHIGEIPSTVVDFIRRQLKLNQVDFQSYRLSGRVHQRHRSQIREFFGYCRIDNQRKQQLKQWLISEVLPEGPHLESLRQQVSQYLRAHKIELPSAKEIARLIRSATRAHDQQFCRSIAAQINPQARAALDALLETETFLEKEDSKFRQSEFNRLKSDPGRLGLTSLLKEIEKLQRIRQIKLPLNLFENVSGKLVQQYRRRASAEQAGQLRRHPAAIRYTLIATFCHQRLQEITDNLVELLVQIIHRLHINAERRVERELIENYKRVNNKEALLYRIAGAAIAQPGGLVQEVIYPIADPTKLEALIKEQESTGITYKSKVYTRIRSSYLHHYRRMVPAILETLAFQSNNETHQPVIKALALLKQYQGLQSKFFSADEEVVIKGVLKSDWRELVLEKDPDGQERMNRVNYEICVLQALREKLRSREIWVHGAKQYGNPEQDLPQDFEQERDNYYGELQLPLDGMRFVANLKQQLTDALSSLNKGLPSNPHVRIQKRQNKGWISVSPLSAQAEPPHLSELKQEVAKRWPLTSLLDILKETDLRVNFTEQFQTVVSRENLDRATLQRRLLLTLYGLGTNTGLKRVCAGMANETSASLSYVKRNFIHSEHLRNAITKIVNATFKVRQHHIWGDATTACASDSKQFAAWDQNLMTQWHARYGGRGLMIYWHVEKKSVCVYSHLKTCASSEAAAMLRGLLRHNTEMKLEKNYVDTHGQNEIAFAFCNLLGFELMPRFKRIGAQRLYLPESGSKEDYPNLKLVLTRAIDWELIVQQYDQMIKYATALRLGMAEIEAILRNFSRTEIQHPTHKALAELGKAVKSIFVCRYLHSEALRQEINDGLNVVERWNGANDFIFYGRGGEISSNQFAHQEVSALALHLLQSCMVYINTLMIQRVLSDPTWMARMELEDMRALTPLIWNHITPYGIFNLDFNERLALEDPYEMLVT